MPIYESRELIPFVNNLELQIQRLMEDIAEWNSNRHRIINSVARADSAYGNAIQALVRADEAMTEIGTATFRSTAVRGKRLEDTLNNLKNEMHEIAEMVQAEGGGGALTEGVFYDELNHAIATVDPTVEDGLKLDYRLREITALSAKGESLANKKVHMPYKVTVEESFKEKAIVADAGVVFISADVTVLNEQGDPILHNDGELIRGTIDEDGLVVLNHETNEAVNLYFPVEMRFEDIPEDFLNLLLDQILQKNNQIMESIMTFDSTIEKIISDIEGMKGVNWTPDFSIMKNHQDILKESITPKGLRVEVKDDMAHLTFSYSDHPQLSHFIVEKWDEDLKKYVPYDGDKGIIQK